MSDWNLRKPAKKKVDKTRECVQEGNCPPPRAAARKDKNAWCGGKAGVDHHWEWVEQSRIHVGGVAWRHVVRKNTNVNKLTEEWIVCTKCGKMPYINRTRCGCCGEIVKDSGHRPAWLKDEPVKDPYAEARAHEQAHA
jgi:hypothetical protein